MPRIELGQKVWDKVTGVHGIVTARVEYLFGRTQVQVEPHGKSDGDFAQVQWLDEGRVEPADGPRVVAMRVQAKRVA